MTDKIVRYEPALALSGLFRPLQARQQQSRVSITQQFKGMTFEWVAAAPPGIPEQTLLLALMSLAGPGMQRLSQQATSPVGRQLRQALMSDGEIFSGETASIRTSLSELAKLCGYAECGGANLTQVKQMLRRLSEITVWIRTRDFEASSRLLSVIISSSGNTRVALNTQLATAAWGETQYVKICMNERLVLTSQPAMALHTFLSGVIKPGKEHCFTWTSLERAVWGGNTEGSTFRSRKAKLTCALAEMTKKGWTIKAEKKVVSVSRHNNNKISAKQQQNNGKATTQN